MQLANSTNGDPALRSHVRRATHQDAAGINHLLRNGVYVHLHADWRLPGDRLGSPGFVVFDQGGGPAREGIAACLAVAAEPRPAAWVRVAAVTAAVGYAETSAMFAAILPELDPGITEIAWFLGDYWPLGWLEMLGFVPINEVVEYRKEGLEAPQLQIPAGLEIRPLLMEDLDALERIEVAAFEPRWRHSAKDLYLAWRQSISFEVAFLHGEPVAYQFSTGGEKSAHLSRMTVRPDAQGMGIGAALLGSALANYRTQRITRVTLNTQSDNHASRKLYERFGFRLTGHSYPVWSYFIS